MHRRIVVTAMAVTALLVANAAWSQQKEVRVAMIAPMSGPWARQGELMKKGADMAIEDINRAGGSASRSCPSKTILPEAAGTVPDTVLKSVVLPAPLGPTMATNCPASTARETSVSALRPP